MVIVGGLLLILFILVEAFETILLPRVVTRGYRLTRLFFLVTWRPWRALACRISARNRREDFLSLFGPLSMLMLLILWAACLILGFGAVLWGVQSPLPRQHHNWVSQIYLSGTTFFTLGLGDIEPIGPVAKIVVVAEAGFGFGFLAVVIGYLPVLYQSFSAREAFVLMLESRAGAPPSAMGLLRRLSRQPERFEKFLEDAERWLAQLLEGQLSYPVLSLYRSQHDQESWLGAIGVVLDCCALARVGLKDVPALQAELTFRMALNTLREVNRTLHRKPQDTHTERLAPEEFHELAHELTGLGIPFTQGVEAEAELARFRRMYEPYLWSVSDYLLIPVPAWARRGELMITH